MTIQTPVTAPRINPILTAALKRPSYRIDHEPNTDHMLDPWDITDAWFEATGDEDQTASAFFDHNHDFGQYNPSLVGLRVSEGDTVFYYSDIGALLLLGEEAACRIEAAYSEEMNG